MESFRSGDNLVGKHLHQDGSETAVKSVSSCDTVRDPATGRLQTNPADRRKYSIFASASSGCFMRCAFCHLTVKRAPYRKLSEEGILANLLEAVAAERAANPGIADRYAKVGWMGMGEDHMLRPAVARRVTVALLERLVADGAALGVDGCDIATVLPPGADIGRCADEFSALDERLAGFPANPNNAITVHAANGYRGPADRTLTRLFWSLHSAVPATRLALIPNSGSVGAAAARIRAFRARTGLNLVIHHFFLEGVNDTAAEADALAAFLRDEGLLDAELRILRYNPHRQSGHGESSRFDGLVGRISAAVPRLKVQISSGAEVQAACGQFIARNSVDSKAAA